MINLNLRISLLFCLISLSLFSQKKDVVNRIEHINSHAIYVSQMNFEKDSKTTKIKSDVPSSYSYKRINQYVRECFSTFWEISDTVIFMSWDELQIIKKKEKENIFFEFGYSVMNDRIQNNFSNYFTSFGISCPGEKKLFSNMVTWFQSDSSFLDIATKFRRLKNTCTTGSDINSNSLGEKIILINEVPPTHPVKLDYWKKVRAKYKGNYLEVKYSTILESVKSKDPRYIYVHGYSTYNAEDGSVIYIL